VDDEGTNFALWSDGAEGVELCLFDDDGRQQVIPLDQSNEHVWHGYLPGVGHGQRYGYRVRGPWAPEIGKRFNLAKLLLDPYARAITGELVPSDVVTDHVPESDDRRDNRDSAGFVPRSVVVRDSFDWGDEQRPRIAWNKTVLYELHVKGFTQRHPRIPEHLRGTYAGLAHPTAIEHLVSLGVTSVELLPVQQFVSEPFVANKGLSNYWGYNTIGFFAPHAAYSSSGSLGQQITEFKAMVKALHAAGLEVILDVVYNHTGESGPNGPTLAYRGIDNDSYYRREGRRYVDLTGCGNTLDTRRSHVVQLVADSLRYWVQEMHVDGFRFDLASAIARLDNGYDPDSPLLSVIQQDPVLSQVKLIAEPWDLAPGGYAVGHFPPQWSEWNDRYRDAIRDFWRPAATGVRDLATRLSGSSDLYGYNGRAPRASVNFITAHDGFTLRDLVTYNDKHNDANGEDNRDGNSDNRSWNTGVEGETDDVEIRALRRRQIRNLLTTLLLSTGTPMLTAGDELGRTQGGNNNAYCQDNEISWMDWDLQPWQQQLLEWSQALLGVRRRHPVLRQKDFFEGRPVREGATVKDLGWFDVLGAENGWHDWSDNDDKVLGMYLSGEGISARGPRGEVVYDESFLLVFNGTEQDAEFTLPGEPWARSYRRVLDTANEAPIEAAADELPGSKAAITARSVAVFRAARR
jgi:glycogen operon protein